MSSKIFFIKINLPLTEDIVKFAGIFKTKVNKRPTFLLNDFLKLTFWLDTWRARRDSNSRPLGSKPSTLSS